MSPASDPSALWGAVGSTVGAVLALLVAFGIPFTPDQQAAILGVFAAVGPLVTALLIRRTAWAPTSVRTVVASAYAEGAAGEPPRRPRELLADPARDDVVVEGDWTGEHPPSPPLA